MAAHSATTGPVRAARGSGPAHDGGPARDGGAGRGGGTATLPASEVELLRFTTAGSVDDGKSTLIGRLLHDTRSVFDDQFEQLQGAGRGRGAGRGEGAGGIDLALLTDGLRDERAQGITIDVAYRYFATPKRRFIIADTPGHLQYTRNMVTGASTADLAVILIDASKGLLTQSRRHAFISSLLGIEQLVVAVNKMDLVEYRPGPFERIRAEFSAFARRLEGVREVAFVPISALEGDQVVERSDRMPWHTGPTLLEVLEAARTGTRRRPGAFRFPVQSVIRPNAGFRGYAGTVSSGSIAVGDEVVVLPSGESTAVRSIETADGTLDRARAGEAVVLTTRDELDISRGDLIAPAGDPPAVASRLAADLCWMDREALEPGRTYLLLSGTRQVQVRVDRIVHRVEVDTLGRKAARALGLNEIGRVELSAAEPFAFDPYRANPGTGSFVLIDLRSNQTAGAGMIRERLAASRPVSPGVVWQEEAIPRSAREARNGHRAAVVWLTGISGAGKSSIAREVERLLFERGAQTALLDGDRLRHGLSGDLGFSDPDRAENLRRAGEVARILFDHGAIVMGAFISPRSADRERVRALIPEGRFFEIHVHAPVDVARERDPKGLYEREREGSVGPLPGSLGPWEPPPSPELHIDTTRTSPAGAARRVLARLEEAGILDSPEHPEHPEHPTPQATTTAAPTAPPTLFRTAIMTTKHDGDPASLPPVCSQGTAELPEGLELEREAAITPLRIGYERIGSPDAPAVVVLGGISAQAHICAHEGDPRDGWWQRLAGVDRPLDAGALQLIGMDWVGGPGGSSAPPEPVEPGGIPAVTTGDQARALAALLDHLEIDRVAAVVGASYGAMVGLAFGALFPDRAARIVAISGAHRSHPMATALRALQRRIALLGDRSGDRRRGLVLARALAMTTYRSAEEFNERFGMDPHRADGAWRFEVEDYLEHQGEIFAERFDLMHFLCLCQSLDLHRVDPGAIGTPTTLIAITEDTLVPLWQMRELHRALGDRGELIEIDSPYGHDAFLVEEESVGGALRRILSEVTGQGAATGRPSR